MCCLSKIFSNSKCIRTSIYHDKLIRKKKGEEKLQRQMTIASRNRRSIGRVLNQLKIRSTTCWLTKLSGCRLSNHHTCSDLSHNRSSAACKARQAGYNRHGVLCTGRQARHQAGERWSIGKDCARLSVRPSNWSHLVPFDGGLSFPWSYVHFETSLAYLAEWNTKRS